MIKFRERWPAALIFAIILHAGIFFIFYINIDNDNLNDLPINQENATNTVIPSELANKYLPDESQVYTTTLITGKTSSILDDSSKNTADQSKIISLEATENRLPYSKEPIEDNSSSSRKLENVYVALSQEADIDVKNRRVVEDYPRYSKDNEFVENIVSDVGLLNMDAPIKSNTIQKNEEYDSVKAETEEINSQLSSAINEVKQRNQQKIDQIQRLQPYFYDSEDKSTE